jgi:hypothetical protein
MQIEKKTRQKIIRDLAISLFIYALPVLLMFLSFYVTGNKPWLKTPQKSLTQRLHH